MICPDCGCGMEVERTARSATVTVRVERCQCGSRFESEQRISRRMTPATGSARVAHGSHGEAEQRDGNATGSARVAVKPPPNATGSLPASAGGVGGGLSGRSDLPLFPSYPDPDPSKDLDQEVDRPRAKRLATPIQYPTEFSSFWDNAESPSPKGLKSVALERWERRGKPSPEILLRKWGEYLGSLGDQSAMHVCRWIGNRGWEEVYRPARGIGPYVGNPKTAGNIDVLRNFSSTKEHTG